MKGMKRLMTNEEKQAKEDFIQDRINNPVNDIDDIDWEGYMSRQPRFDLRKHNFNFEEYDKYIKMYEEADALDKEKSKQFYRLVNYVKEHTDSEDARTNMIV